MDKFMAELEIIGVNPFVHVPHHILLNIFNQSGKNKGFIPIHGTINSAPYQQTLVRFKGIWRLYINTKMLKNSPKRIGEEIEITVEFDPRDRSIVPHPKFLKAMDENEKAKIVFDSLSPSGQTEIIRYIANLKTEESVDRNVIKAVDFLLGKGRFVGRDHP